MAGTTTTLAYLLKTVYSQREVENAVYKDNPLLAMIRKEPGFDGASHVHAIRYRDAMGRSPAFSTAQTGAQAAVGTSIGAQFVVTRVKNYAVYTLETEAILAGKSDKGALMRTLTTEVDSALNNLGRDIAINVYRDGAGDRGQLTSIAGAGPYTWTVGEGITNFEVGDTVVVSAGSTKTDALRSAGAGVAITSVNRAAGTFTTAAQIADPAVANDWIFISGDRQAGAITANSQNLKLAGLDAWNPSSVTSTSFFGIDRTTDSSRLGGLQLDVSALNPEEGLVTAMARLAREGGDPDYLFVSYLDNKNIQLSLGSKAVAEYMSVGDIGFSTIRVTGPKGDVMVVADQNCPAAVGRLVTMDTWAVKHLNDFINHLDLDGAALSREASADRFEGRFAMFGNVVCYAPGKNMRMILPS